MSGLSAPTIAISPGYAQANTIPVLVSDVNDPRPVFAGIEFSIFNTSNNTFSIQKFICEQLCHVEGMGDKQYVAYINTSQLNDVDIVISAKIMYLNNVFSPLSDELYVKAIAPLNAPEIEATLRIDTNSGYVSVFDPSSEYLQDPSAGIYYFLQYKDNLNKQQTLSGFILSSDPDINVDSGLIRFPIKDLLVPSTLMYVAVQWQYGHDGIMYLSNISNTMIIDTLAQPLPPKNLTGIATNSSPDLFEDPYFPYTDLSWNPPSLLPFFEFDRYRIYRKQIITGGVDTSSNEYIALVDLSNNVLHYHDSAVEFNNSYNYVIVSVTADGAESIYSNEILIVYPDFEELTNINAYQITAINNLPAIRVECTPPTNLPLQHIFVEQYMIDDNGDESLTDTNTMPPESLVDELYSCVFANLHCNVTYYYKLRAVSYNDFSNNWFTSNNVVVPRPAPVTEASAVQVTAVNNLPSIVVSWTLPENTDQVPVQTIKVEQFKNGSLDASVDLSGADISYQFENLSSNASYYYVITSYSYDEVANEFPVETNQVDVPRAAPVTDASAVKVTAVNNLPSIVVSWVLPENTAQVPVETIRVEQYKNGSFDASVDLSNNVVSHQFENLSSNASYYYVITSYSYDEVANEFPVETNSVSTDVMPPIDLATMINDQNPAAAPSITLSWSPPDNMSLVPVETYTIYFRDNSGNDTNVSVDSSINSIVFTDIIVDKTFEYYIKSFAYDGGVSVNSDTISQYVEIPAAVQGLSASNDHASNTLTLTWSLPSNYSTIPPQYYKIEYKKSTEDTWTTPTSTLSGNSTTYIFTDVLVPGNTYNIQVTSIPFIYLNTTALSYMATSIVIHRPYPVNSIVATYNSENRNIDITWVNPNDMDCVLNFKLEKLLASVAGSTWTTLTSPVKTSTSFTDTDVSSGMTYAYRIRTEGYQSSASDWVTSSNITPYRQASVVQQLFLTAYSKYLLVQFNAPANLYDMVGNHYVVEIYDMSDILIIRDESISYAESVKKHYDDYEYDVIQNDVTYKVKVWLVTSTLEVVNVPSTTIVGDSVYSNNATTGDNPIILDMTQNDGNGNVVVNFISNILDTDGTAFTPFTSYGEMVYSLTMLVGSTNNGEAVRSLVRINSSGLAVDASDIALNPQPGVLSYQFIESVAGEAEAGNDYVGNHYRITYQPYVVGTTTTTTASFVGIALSNQNGTTSKLVA
jgi:hypothetical protein